MLKMIPLFAILLVSQASFAWNNRDFPSNPTNVSFLDLENLASDVQRLTFLYSRELNKYEQRDVYRLLRQAREILLYSDNLFRACATQEPEVMRRAFLTIKHMAQASTGLAMTNNDAVKFTQNWLENYTCDEAEQFVSFVRQMRLFSGAETGLAMKTAESVQYTMRMANNYCGDKSFENDFRVWFSLASSATGMNLPVNEARDYAKQKMEAFHFSCQL